MASIAYSELPLNQLQDLELKLAQIKLQYSGFTIFTLSWIIEQEIVDEIHRQMRNNNVSEKVVETTYLEKRTISSSNTKGLEFFIKSDYVSESGFPVAIMIERGRKEYDVPKFPIPPTPERPNPHLKYIDKDGKAVYRKKVKIPRKEAGNYIVDTIRDKKPDVVKKFNEVYAGWISSILKG